MSWTDLGLVTDRLYHGNRTTRFMDRGIKISVTQLLLYLIDNSFNRIKTFCPDVILFSRVYCTLHEHSSSLQEILTHLLSRVFNLILVAIKMMLFESWRFNVALTLWFSTLYKSSEGESLDTFEILMFCTNRQFTTALILLFLPFFLS